MTIRVKGISLSHWFTRTVRMGTGSLVLLCLSHFVAKNWNITPHTTHNSKTTQHQRMNFIGWTQKIDGTSGRRGAFFTDVCAKLVEIWDLYMLHGVPLDTMWDQSMCIHLRGQISHFTTFVPWVFAFRRRKSKEVVRLFEECFFITFGFAENKSK